jgi:hypothetical protein
VDVRCRKNTDLKISSPSVSPYYRNLLDVLTEEHNVTLYEIATFLKHTWIKHGQKAQVEA